MQELEKEKGFYPSSSDVEDDQCSSIYFDEDFEDGIQDLQKGKINHILKKQLKDDKITSLFKGKNRQIIQF